MKIAIVRGAYLNKYEMQSYEPLIGKFDLVGFSSLKPIHSDFKLPVVKLFSPMDLPNFPYKMPILNRILGDAQVLYGLEKRLNGFDIAHCAETYFYFTQQCLNAKKKGYIKKVVSTVWENIPFNNEGIRKRKEFKKRAIEGVDHFICVSDQAREALIKEGCKKCKISVVYPGVNLNQFKNQRSKIKNRIQKSKVINLLFVGRLVEEKGIWELLEAYKSMKYKVLSIKYKQEIPSIRLKIVGDGREKLEMIKKIKEWGLEKEVEIKKVDYEKMPEVYQEADIFILPSKSTKYWQEQFGMVLIEAMASGLAIIAAKSGAIPEAMAESGLLINEEREDKLIKAIITLINNKNLRLKLGEIGRKRVETFFDAKKQAEKIGEIYQKSAGS